MKERPILFNTEMVQAILEGRKIQTRRIVKGEALDWLDSAGFTPKFVSDPGNFHSRYGYKGDILWVRETWVWEGDTKYTDVNPLGNFYYKADFKGNDGPSKWKPSIHMPKEACRLRLKITDVRIERLNDISLDAAVKEGILIDFYEMFQECRYRDYMDINSNWRDPISSFKSLWESINGKDSWKVNPWVWVIKFEKLD